MATISYDGKSANYTVCTENYDKALGSNKKMDAVVDKLQTYKTAISQLQTSGSEVLKEGCSLMSGINSHVSSILNAINMFGDSISTMQADNLSEAKKVDDEVTESNKQKALSSLKSASESSASSND